MDKAAVRKLFERYERLFNDALGGGDVDMQEIASLYTEDVIGVSPAGVMVAKNDDEFRQRMAQAYARNREIGTREMRINDLRQSAIDDHHCVAHVGWTATYARAGHPDAVIDFFVHYLVRQMQGGTRVFGWVSGDEQALLQKHGIVGA